MDPDAQLRQSSNPFIRQFPRQPNFTVTPSTSKSAEVKRPTELPGNVPAGVTSGREIEFWKA